MDTLSALLALCAEGNLPVTSLFRAQRTIYHGYTELWWFLFFTSDKFLNIQSIGMWNDVTIIQWGRVTHICVSKLTIIGSDNGLSPGRRQAIICTNVGILLFRTLGRNFSEILSEIHTFLFKKRHLKMSSAILSRPQCVNMKRQVQRMDNIARLGWGGWWGVSWNMSTLTHCGIATPYVVKEVGQHWLTNPQLSRVAFTCWWFHRKCSTWDIYPWYESES